MVNKEVMRIDFLFRIIFVVALCFAGAVACASEPSKKSQQVMYYPAGVHKIQKIESDTDFLAIKGDGSGITVLEIPEGIVLTGREPRLSGFTLKGSKNQGTGLTLRNNYRALVEDVEIQGYELGLLSICDYGSRQWLHTYRDLYIYEGPDGSQRTYNKKIRGIELRYEGEKAERGGWKSDGGFSNTHTFYGGRIAVPGTPLLIDGPSATAMFGTYIDMTAPLRMTKRSSGLQLFGVHLDRNRKARKDNLPVMVLENPVFNRVKIFGQHANLFQQNLIVDGEGRPANSKDVFIWPEKY